MNRRWTTADLIDLDYCLAADRDVAEAELHERDRRLYLDWSGAGREEDRETLLRHWLDARRAQLFSAGASPGQALLESLSSAGVVLVLGAAAVGLAAGLTFFSYSGTTPVNVINFLFIFVFSQLLALLLLGLGALLRAAGVAFVPAPVIGLYRLLAGWLVERSPRLSRLLPAESRSRLSQAAGLLKSQHTLQGGLFHWPLFRLSQRVMVAFNLGLLSATFFRILTSDLAFGWQSTIQFSTEFIFRMTRVLALPWSWFVPSRYASPSAAEIEGSRIVLKDGIYHLQTLDLVSWWPFLLLCILVYGVLVRLLLLRAGGLIQRRTRRHPEPNRPALLQVIRRMQTPVWRSQADGEAGQGATRNRPDPGPGPAATGPADASSLSLLLLVPEEISAYCTLPRLEEVLAGQGWAVRQGQVVPAASGPAAALFEELRRRAWRENEGIVLIQESWMPPINETLDFIREIRARAGDRVPLFIGLLGQGTTATVVGRPAAVEREVWRRRLEALADPYLALLDLEREDAT